MLTRQRTILGLLSEANRPLNPTVFVKLAFLLRQETELAKDRTFYDFLPYKYGPFSFTLYKELANLRKDGYVSPDNDKVFVHKQGKELVNYCLTELKISTRRAVADILDRYGNMSKSSLLKEVYSKYPWYATKSELVTRRPKSERAPFAVYTAGYEQKSVDLFFDRLLKSGIEMIIDVRANPISRRYGFSKTRLMEIATKLGLKYRHIPQLGIPGKLREDLNDYASYQRLLNRYESEILPKVGDEIREAARLMLQMPAVLVCVEKDVRCCHRGRLADNISATTGMEVMHL